jgi:cytochrome c oxidase subunit IV
MSHRVMSPVVYWVVFVALVVLTFLTTYVSTIHLAHWQHTAVGMVIATCKAGLVLLFFMQVIRSTRLTWATILSTLFFLTILIVLTMNDYLTRQLTPF